MSFCRVRASDARIKGERSPIEGQVKRGILLISIRHQAGLEFSKKHRFARAYRAENERRACAGDEVEIRRRDKAPIQPGLVFGPQAVKGGETNRE